MNVDFFIKYFQLEQQGVLNVHANYHMEMERNRIEC